MMRRLPGAFILLMMAGTASAQPAPATAETPAKPPLIQAPVEIPPATPENTLHLDLSTGGRVTIQLRPDVAPKGVERIKTLVGRHFYDGVVFHRVIEGFMAQTGDPTATGMGGSDLPDLKAEFSTLPHVRGTVSMARAQSPDSANSQFFIIFQPTLRLDGNYTVVGRVIGGMQYVDAVARGEPPSAPSRIVRASMATDNVPAPPQQTPIPAASPASPPVDSPGAVPAQPPTDPASGR